MARPADIPLRPDMTFGEAAALTITVRAGELFDHSGGVLDTTDIERVHDMRVASRRLRAALEIFEPAFPRRAHRGVLRDVKGLADALGQRRDPDVQLAALDGAKGLRILVERLEAQQAAGNEALAAALADAERTNLKARLLALAGEASR